MPIFDYTCTACKFQFEEIFLTFDEVKKTKAVLCPKCQRAATRNEVQVPAKFMGCYGEAWLTAPSKRHSTKKINKDKTNAG